MDLASRKINPGDLAIIVQPVCGCTGKCVTCLRVVPNNTLGEYSGAAGPLWEIDMQVPWVGPTGRNAGDYPYIPESYLIPIQPPKDMEVEKAIAATERVV